MAQQSTPTIKSARPGRRQSRRIVEAEAYRRIMAGDLPQALSEFAAQLSAWFEAAHPGAPAMPASAVEEAIRDTWHRRHELIGSEL